MKLSSSSIQDSSRPSKEEAHKYGNSREAMSNKYAAIREQSRQSSKSNPVEKNITSAKVSLLHNGKAQSSDPLGEPSSSLASKWESMKNNIQSFRANIGARRFFPLRQNHEDVPASHTQVSASSDSLDEIFQRLKRPNLEHASFSDEDEDGSEIRVSRPAR